MFLQRVDNVFDLEWGGGVKYAEVRLQEEIEQSKYAFGQVDMPAEEFAAVHRDLFDRNFAFAEKLLASGLVWPALEYCLKCSHLFNILDSSGSIGVTERTAFILRVRQLAIRIAKAYAGLRDERGGGSVTGLDRELLIEIGCEEIPASWLPGLTTQLGRHLDARLKEFRLTGEGAAETYSTPRRLTARVAKLSERQTDFEELVTGPPVSAAFGPDGQPTPAATGFARKYGVEVDGLERQETPKGVYLAYRLRQRGKATVDVLADLMTGLLRDMTFPKQMRWDAYLEDGKGDLPVCASDPVARAPVRRPRRSFRDSAHRAGSGTNGSGHPVRVPTRTDTAF